ncbi:MAG: complex I subunit 1 family protein [Elusimicrobiota bacterium]
MINTILEFIVFPGFLFTATVGMLASWVDRKVTARVQWRVGPPLLQPLYDFVKLLGKEVVIPSGVNVAVFLLMPVVSFMVVIMVSIMLWQAFILQTTGFTGDLIVVVYMLMIPALAVIIGASASANPLASLGASREMKLVLAYELPFILACIVPVIKSGGMLKLQGLIHAQNNGVFMLSLSGICAFAVAVLCIQAKLGMVPFDAAEAETEIAGGVLIEYSGLPLALFKLVKQMLLFVLPMLLITLFLGGVHLGSIFGVFNTVLKYVFVITLIILIRNTNPRVRVDQAVKFFWGKVSVVAVLAVVFALLGY